MEILIPNSILNKPRTKDNIYIQVLLDDTIHAFVKENEKIIKQQVYTRNELLAINPRVISYIKNYNKKLTKLIV